MLEHPCCYLFYLFKFNLNGLILGIICNLVLTNLKILLLLNLLLMMLEKFGCQTPNCKHSYLIVSCLLLCDIFAKHTPFLQLSYYMDDQFK